MLSEKEISDKVKSAYWDYFGFEKVFFKLVLIN
jgi:hypothetical protein